jgi:hypothetical protein
MKNKLGPNLTFLNIFELKGFRMFAPQQKQKCMKNLLLTSLITLLGISSFAQEAKKEATIKIVVIENGKEKVIERKYSDIQKADAEIKKLSDSLDLKISTSGGKNKIVRIEVNKDDRRGGRPQMEAREGKELMIREGKELNIITEDFKGDLGPGGPGGGRMIIRRMNKGGNPADVLILRDNDSINPNMGPRRNFDMQGHPPIGKFMKGRKTMRGGMAFGRMGGRNKMIIEHQKNGSKTINGLISYPNKPFNGKLNVRFKAPEKGNVTISVTDVNGKEIASEQIKDFSGLYLGQIDVKKSGAGVYFVRVTQSNDGAVRRVQVD